jgi:hypothetical protein
MLGNMQRPRVTAQRERVLEPAQLCLERKVQPIRPSRYLVPFEKVSTDLVPLDGGYAAFFLDHMSDVSWAYWCKHKDW